MLHLSRARRHASGHRRTLVSTGILATAAVVGALTLSGCSAGGSSSAATGDTLNVLASFYPLQFVAERVGGDLVTVTNMTPSGGEPHDLELSPAMVRQVGEADLVVYLSGFQPAVDQAVDEQKPAHAVDAADVVSLIPVGDHPSEAIANESGITGDDATDGHSPADSLDPHFWLDPTLLEKVSTAVADELSSIDPTHEATYQANASELNTELDELDADFTAGLSNCAESVFVTTHEAFGYLADRYHLDEIGISGVTPDAEPSPARLKEISGIVEQYGITTIFFETLTSPKVAQTLASDLGVTTAVLDPVESLAKGATDYISVMRSNLSALESALQCSAS